MGRVNYASILNTKRGEKIDICEFQSAYRPSSVFRKQMAEFNLGNVSDKVIP